MILPLQTTEPGFGLPLEVVPASPDAIRSLRMVLVSDAIPGRNGVGTYYDDLAQHLGEHVAEFHLVTPPRDRDAPFRGLRFPLPGDGTQAFYVPWPGGLWRRLVDLRPQVVLVATPGPYGFLGLTLARRTGAALCVGHHTKLDELTGLYWRSLTGPILRAGLSLWRRLVVRSGATVLVHNRELLAELEADGYDDVRLVGTPTPRAFLDREPAPLGSTVRRVSFLGRLAPEKRVEQVLEAAEALPDLSFRVVGDGPRRSVVDEAAARLDNLEAIPWVDRRRVLEIVDETDVLVLPSVYETFGTAALEAMARGRIALVSDRCGIGRWPGLREGLVRMTAGEHLISGLQRVRAMAPEARAHLAATGRAAALELTRRTVEHWLGVLTRLASRRAVQ